MRPRHAWFRRFVTVAFAVPVVMAPTPVGAFPRPIHCGGAVRSALVHYVLSPDPRWDERPNTYNWYGWSLREVAERGITRWVGPRNRDATVMVRMSSTNFAGARHVDVVFSDSPGGNPSVPGHFSCGMNRLEINPTFTPYGAGMFADTLAHEMGHAIGAEHTGLKDSLFYGGDGPPTMSTCNDEELLSYTNDDAAVTTHKQAIGASRTLTADYGFETGIRWFTGSGAKPSLVAGSTSGGSYHAMVLPNSSYDNVVQTVNWSMGWDELVRPSLQYVTPGATTGNVKVQLWQRDVTYAYDTTKGYCGFVMRNVDMNVRTPAPPVETGWNLVKEDLYPVSGAWRIGIPQYDYLVQSVTNGSVDLRVRVYSTAAAAGAYVHAHYDDLRIQED
jgi:hypothetical protein